MNPPTQSPKVSLISIICASVATIIEWYDFTAYIFVASLIATLFFPSTNHFLSLMETYIVFASGYIMRPLGGFFFGNLGDKVGRKKVIIIVLMLMALSVLIMAVMPTSQQVGVWAVVLLLFARLLQGFSVGGQHTGVIVMLSEQAKPNFRGLTTSLATCVSGIGVLLSSATVMILTSSLTRVDMLAWGWRVPFFVGFVLAIISMLLQVFVKESPKFERARRENKLVKFPLKDALRLNFKEIFDVFCLTGFLGIAYYLGAAFLPSYLETILNVPAAEAMKISTISAAFYALSAPLWGYLSDLYGRKTILISTTILLILLSFPLFYILAHKVYWQMLVATVVFMTIVSACTAVFVTLINEGFPTSLRLSGVASGYNLGNAVFGGTTPLVATFLIEVTGNNIAPCYYLIVASLFILILMLRLPETSRLALS